MKEQNSIFKKNPFYIAIGKSWAHFFKMTYEDICQPTIKIIERAKLNRSKTIYLWDLRDKIIIDSPTIFSSNIASLNGLEIQEPTELISEISKRIISEQLLLQDRIYLYHLEPEKYVYQENPPKYFLRHLNKMDRLKLTQLKMACTKFEVQNSWIQSNHLEVLGCFDKNKLISAGSYINWGEAKEIGVLTHPKYRKQGIGKAIVSQLCNIALRENHILLYRCHEGNIGSIKIANELGFDKLFEQLIISPKE